MKSPPHQIHDDIAFNRVEAFIRGEDNETLVGTEEVKPAPRRRPPGQAPPAPGEVDEDGQGRPPPRQSPDEGRASRAG